MNTEQTSKNIFTYIKTHYGETILGKIQKLENTMIKYSSYTNHLQFSLRCASVNVHCLITLICPIILHMLHIH